MSSGTRLVFVIFAAVSADAQSLLTPGHPVEPGTRAEMFRSACGVEIENGRCPANPIDGTGGNWTLDAIQFGHFLSAQSEDAIVTTSGFEPLSWFPVGSMLMSKRHGRWQALGIYRVHLDVRVCRVLHASNGRDALLCHVNSRGDGVQFSTVVLVSASFDDLDLKDVFVAADSTERCQSAKPDDTQDGDRARIRRAWIDSITLRGAAVGARLVITAHFGFLAYTAQLHQACRAATERKPGALFPDPPTTQFVVEYVFDGSSFNPTSQSAEAARIFQ